MESEAATRIKRIDPRLIAQGWAIVDHQPSANLVSYAHHAVREYPTANEPADYALFALADSIERRVAAAIARTDKVPQAILAKAFRGELVPTEAELARAEGRDYEPASVLLDRIRKEREAAGPTGGRGRKKTAPAKAPAKATSPRSER